MKKVVLLAPYFLPRRRVGSWRPFKFAIHLKEFGWEPHIITIKDSNSKLTKKEKRLLTGISIYEIEPPFDFTQQSGSQMKKNKSLKKPNVAKKIFNPVLNWVDKNFPIDTWLPLFFLRLNAIQQHVKNISPDVLWSTGDPWSSHWLARKIAAKTKLPWVADFRDPWTLGGVNLKRRSKWSNAVDQKEERKIIKNASVLTFTSQRTEELYRKHFDDLNPRTETLYNCFDFELYDHPEKNKKFFNDQYLNILFFGKFRRLSPARPIVDILAEINKGSIIKQQPIRIHSFGPLSDADTSYARNKGALTYFKSHQPIPGEKALSVLSQADVLLLSTDPARTNIIPAKLWDYLAAQKPILSIAPNPEIERILERTGAGMQLSHRDISPIADLLEESILAKQQGKPLPIPASLNKEKIKDYEAKQITQKLAHIFDELA